MSHFTNIKTKIKEKEVLLEALNLLGHEVKQDQELVVGNVFHAENHPIVQADLCIATDIGFRWNDEDKVYDLVTDLQTWSLPTPPSRFLDKVTQQYARMMVHDQVKQDGWQVEEEWEMDDNSIELTVTRWVQFLKKFIFDVDGTLTPSRQRITSEFLPVFVDFISKNDVYLVTGSDRTKTLEQVTPEIYNSCKRVYNCSGSDVYESDNNVYRDDWELPKDVQSFLYDELNYSQFMIRNGNHIERRLGGVNFTILGRAEDPFVGRDRYIEWDRQTNERQDIAERIRNQFPDLTVAVGGQTGLDIGPKGSDKSQILRDFSKDDEIHFFGDMMKEGQNDYSLAKAVQEMGGYSYHVKDWKDTESKINS